MNWEDGGDKSVSSDESSSESTIGEVLRVEGMKRNSSSLCLVAVGWRGVNLDEDCTLPHVSYWTPPDSTGFRRTCHLDFFSVTRAKLACFVRRSPAESGIFWRSPRNSVIFFRWTTPAESNRISTRQESSRVQRIPPDKSPAESTGFHQTRVQQSPADSTGQESSRVHRIPPESSGFQQRYQQLSLFNY